MTIFRLSSLILSFLFCCIIHSGLLAQKYELLGALTLSDSQIISYKLTFDIAENDSIFGSSITDFYGPNKTASQIAGILDPKKQLLSFSELGNTKTKVKTADFCFVHVNKLKFLDRAGKLIVNGKFNGTLQSGEECATGTIYLVSATVFENIKSIVDTLNIDSLQSLTNRIDTVKNVTLRSNHQLKLKPTDKTLLLEVWDGNVEDNDMIDIYINDELWQDKILLKNEKKTFELPKNNESFVLKIVARNEGFSGINTVNFKLHNVEGLDEFTSELKKGESFVLVYE